MSAKITAVFSGEVNTGWEQQPAGPSGGKPHHQMKVQLDDETVGQKTWKGRFVMVKSYDSPNYLVPVREGDRVFVVGTVEAKGYTNKKTNQPAAFLVVYAKTITIEQEPLPVVATQVASNDGFDSPAPAAGTPPPEEDDIPF